MNALKTALLALALPIFFYNSSKAQEWKPQPVLIPTRWAKQVKAENPLPEYPRPQLERKNWQNLNGLWEYSISQKDVKNPISYQGKILVPYPVESALSGVKKQLKADELLWYKRTFFNPVKSVATERVLLNFGAVDFEATVYVNGKEIGKHAGGYQNFSFDITKALKPGKNELVVKVWDPSDFGPNPHGKQVLYPEGIMYTPSSGIWQTVWLEVVPEAYIQGLKITPDVDKGLVNLTVNSTAKSGKFTAVVKTRSGVLKQVQGDVGVNIAIPIKNARLWSPDDPFLYDLEVTLGRDKVKSYLGMRKIEVKKDEKGIDRIFLNNRYTYNLGTLDQGFWPDGLYTAPTDEALAFDIKASKAMGFNTIRKHIKVEPARWYYHADKLGMLIWQDMVNPGNDTPEGREQFEKENKENITQLYNHPSIVIWVLFNEKWGQYDQERLTKELKALDSTRLVNGHSGEMLYVNDALRSPSPNAWVGADMTDVHAYPNPGHIAFEKGKAAVIGEFGGIGVPIEGHLWDDLKAGWGYDGVVTPPILKKQYTAMVDSLKKLEEQGLTASIYTQPFDVETEQNGLMTYDRQIIKLPVETIREIHGKLWPITTNYLLATKNFTSVVADTISKTYAARLQEYNNGKKDQLFLRVLAVMAKQQKDEGNAVKIATEYIMRLGNEIDESQLNFIDKFTDRSSDPGFVVMKEWVAKNLKAGERNAITSKLQNIIFQEQVKPLLDNEPNWTKIEKIIAANKPLDGELIRGLSVIHYLNDLSKAKPNGAKNVVDAATRYDDLYHSGMYNAWAWAIFGKTSDKALLEKALDWARKSMESESEVGRKAAAIDTYANILHRLGRTQEALEWQNKAVSLSGGDLEIKSNYDKMKRGEKTWPETN